MASPIATAAVETEIKQHTIGSKKNSRVTPATIAVVAARAAAGAQPPPTPPWPHRCNLNARGRRELKKTTLTTLRMAHTTKNVRKRDWEERNGKFETEQISG